MTYKPEDAAHMQNVYYCCFNCYETVQTCINPQQEENQCKRAGQSWSR